MTKWQPGFSLPQHQYIAPEQFRADVDALGRTQWLLADHESRIPEAGDWFTLDWADEQILLIRGEDGIIRGFYNVCRHRGSRLCLGASGQAKMLICPYHAWGYDLQGRLKGAPLMPAAFDKSAHNLKPVHVEVYEGLVFVNFAPGEPPAFAAFTARFDAYFRPFDLKATRIACRHTIPTAANWKLVVENFFECYHCKPSHPTYCAVHDPLKLLALGAGPGSGAAELVAQYAGKLSAWEAKRSKAGQGTGMWADEACTPWLQSAAHAPINEDFQTETLDGRPVGPLLGSLAGFDGGQMAGVFNVLSTVLINNDHAVLFRIVPRGPLQTDFEVIWLVSPAFDMADAAALDRLVEVWSVTAAEDKQITEDNQAGVLSAAYQPGPLSAQEARIGDFGRWYQRLLQA
ncbi:MAG TPA: aromatic ring-hydroxylating dioxygenase subunit alpha [Novosphingobium sp.]|nr:aromatic ring-hydroxylating dioxygenase subunit alpha [Novosphingobium sp.]HZV09512.1 aromatic ring-hydroxylating dioxygenase subunit alpha [Novosphingobium sp.]